MEKPENIDPSKHCLRSNETVPVKSEIGNIQYGNLKNADVPPLNSYSEKEDRLWKILSMLKIEPVVFAYMFAYSMNLSCLTNLMVDKGCLFYYNYTTEVCNNLSAFHKEKEVVEALANNYHLYYKLGSLIAAFMMIFIAPWSDKYSRKFPFMALCFGAFVSDVGFLVCTLQFSSHLGYLILAGVPQQLFGGIVCLFMISFSHSSEVSSLKQRTLKYTFVEVSIGIGMSMGMYCGGALYEYCGYPYVYVGGMIAHLFCLPWIFFIVPETTGLDKTETWKEKACDFFTYENLKKGWNASLKPRSHYDRLIMLLCFFSMCVVVLTYDSISSINFIYTHNIYNWDVPTYSKVNTVYTSTQMIVMLVSAPLLIRVFKLTDYTIGILGSFAIIGKHALFAFARYHVFIYYLGLAAGYWSGFGGLTIRSIISKIVDKEELGQVFAILAVLEALFPMIGTVIVTEIYNATMDIYPSICYLTVVGMMALPLGTYIFGHLVSSSRKSSTTPYKCID